MKKMIGLVAALFALSSQTGGALAETPLGTAFTYQGQLKQNGSPAGGVYNMAFALFDAATSGNQVGPTLTFNGLGGNPPPVAVANGLITVSLDFGASVFAGQRRWLQVSVSGNPLMPRQELTIAPNAQFSQSTRGLTVDANGRVGIANALPTAPLSFQQALGDKIGLWEGNGFKYGFGIQPGLMQIFSANNQADIAMGTGNSASFTETMRVKGNGSVVIGTGGSDARLEVEGPLDAVRGTSAASDENGAGVHGISNGSNGSGVIGVCSNGANARGVWGISSTGYAGRFDGRLVESTPFGNGLYAATGDANDGVFGVSTGADGTGVRGDCNNGSFAYGIWGRSSSGYAGWFDGRLHATTPFGDGVYGETGDGNQGVHGYSNGGDGTGVLGECNVGGSAYGVWGKSTSGYAGYFDGNVHVSGTLSKSGGSFKIDHPLDPANKYLSHSFVESPDMMNVYNGNVTTDANGEAWIELPNYFESLNRDFRYQLTAVGQFAQAMVATEITGNKFSIRTDKPAVKVSWQVTGIRKDAWAEAHRIPVEQDKIGTERGKYLTPELFGASPDLAVSKRVAPSSIQPKAQSTN